jgi:hypothetical protein
MKNTKQIIVLLFISLTFAACRYDEGPMISLRSVETRATNHYILDEFTKNGVDMTQELADSVGKEWQFLTKEEAWGYVNNLMVYPTDSIVPYKANYYISRDNKEIEILFWASSVYPYYYYIGIEPFKGDVYTTWKIERLTKDEMWLSCTYNNADYYLKLKEK